MKRILAFGVLFSCFCTQANGQGNLILNSSFEYHSACPNNSNSGSITSAIPWQGPHSNSTDYFHVCGSNGFGVPSNLFGYEYAEDSFAYAGFSPYLLPNMWLYDYREYAETILFDTLEAGTKYCVSFYISLSDSSEYAVSNISAYFSSTGGGSNPSNYFNYNPQINNPTTNIVTQKNGWVKITGSFTAIGNEQYITIGNFKNDVNTNAIYVGPLITPNYAIAYYYLDNVSVTEIATCIAGVSSQICPNDSTQLGIAPVNGVTYSWQPTTGISNANISNPNASPPTTTTYTLTQIQCEVTTTATVTVTVKNDCDILPPLIIPSILIGNEMFNVSGLPPGSSLSVFDLRGRRVFLSEDYHDEFGSYSVAAGTYVVLFTLPDGSQQKQKLCIIH